MKKLFVFGLVLMTALSAFSKGGATPSKRKPTNVECAGFTEGYACENSGGTTILVSKTKETDHGDERCQIMTIANYGHFLRECRISSEALNK